MRILLTGSSGWLGRYLAPMLRQAGHRVTGLDIAPGVDTDVIGTVADAALIERTFGEYGIEAVIHGGALHKPDIARYPKQAFIDVNVTGTLGLLEAAARAGHDRFVFTSTTSLMISQAIRDEAGDAAVWLDEDSGPIEPRNIYGATKYAAEQLCRLFHAEHGLATIVLRTGRFFPEEDDTHSHPPGENLKANEFLHRRLTVEDAARAHLAALEKAPEIGFGTYIVSAPTPFARNEAAELKHDAATVIVRHFPKRQRFTRHAAGCSPSASAASMTAAASPASWASPSTPALLRFWRRYERVRRCLSRMMRPMFLPRNGRLPGSEDRRSIHR